MYTRETALNRLIESYRGNFDIEMLDGEQNFLVAVCRFYRHTEKYFLSRQANLWTADCEEFVYLFNVSDLSEDIFKKCRDFAWKDGLNKANIGPGHMYTYITPIFVCDNCQNSAKKALRKCRLYKSFKFSFHGWMDCHTAVVELEKEKIATNGSGKYVGKILRNILFKNKRSGSL